jgi:predicted ArsR family transcriptional regulator
MAGRPSKRYRASDLDNTLTFPPRRDDLLANLLARALEILPEEQAAAMAEDVGFDYGRSLASRMAPTEGHRSVKAAVAAVADALTAHGFAAHAESRGAVLTIVSDHCPFGDAAKQYPHVVCAVDRGMIRGLMAGLYGDTQPEFEASRPEGDARCVTRV